MSMYMKIEGIEGDSTQKGHEKWFDISAYTFNAANLGGGMPGSAGGRSGGETQVGEISVSMPGASGVPTITQYVVTGKTVKTVTIESVTSSENPVVYQKWTLSDCAFSNIAVSDSGVGLRDMGISLSISFTHMQFDATAIKDDGKSGATKSVKYDVAKRALS